MNFFDSDDEDELDQLIGDFDLVQETKHKPKPNYKPIPIGQRNNLYQSQTQTQTQSKIQTKLSLQKTQTQTQNHNHSKQTPKTYSTNVNSSKQLTLHSFIPSKPSQPKQQQPTPPQPTQSLSTITSLISSFNQSPQRPIPYTSNPLTGSQWVYPSNYSVREYQQAIALICLQHNTFVSLPTGLGKTLIAAVVMFNFLRWYPRGKILFLAPSKPLVLQQISACASIVGFSEHSMTDMTGKMAPKKREKEWQNADKRVIFATSQTVQNDIRRNRCDASAFVCLVIDEAHHSTKNHTFTALVADITSRNPFIRIVGLSATPGNDLEKVQHILDNLHISKLVVKASEDADIAPYTHQTQLDVVVVPGCSNIGNIQQCLFSIMRPVHHKLVQARLLFAQPVESLNAYVLLKQMGEFQRSEAAGFEKKRFGGDFGLLHALVHSHQRLVKYGLESFKEAVERAFFGRGAKAKKPSQAKIAVRASAEFRTMLQLVEEYLQQSSHPKIKTCAQVLVDHFRQFSEMSGNSQICERKSTRAIVFTTLRTSVDEICAALDAIGETSEGCDASGRPLVRACRFIGQSSGGLGQKQQLEAVHRFKAGVFNTIVATCIAEEGLDIGQVDLIVCFDVKKSPIRATQRMGRTGRKRKGRCVVLVNEGREETEYRQNVTRNSAMIETLKKMADGAQIRGKKLVFSGNRTPMVPEGIVLQLVYENRKGTVLQRERVLKKKASTAFLGDVELVEFERRYRLSEKEREGLVELIGGYQGMWGCTQRLEREGRVGRVGHGRDTKGLFKLAQFVAQVKYFGLVQGFGEKGNGNGKQLDVEFDGNFSGDFEFDDHNIGQEVVYSPGKQEIPCQEDDNEKDMSRKQPVLSQLDSQTSSQELFPNPYTVSYTALRNSRMFALGMDEFVSKP